MATPGIRIEPPYNPLAKENLGKSVADALLEREMSPLPPTEKFIAAGVYAVYYTGSFKAYAPLVEENRTAAKQGNAQRPIYIGKAVPARARKGGFGLGAAPGLVSLHCRRRYLDSARRVDVDRDAGVPFENDPTRAEHAKQSIVGLDCAS
jgi:hypothetical protein